MDQHFRFVGGRCTEFNFLQYTSYLSEALESNKQVGAIYTDFFKVFDEVNHKILIHKLIGWGFSDPCGSYSSYQLEFHSSCHIINQNTEFYKEMLL